MFPKRQLILKNWDNKNISEAIYHHTIGDTDNKLAKILYIADKTEPLRGYDTEKEIEMSIKDLEKAFEIVKKEQREYIKLKNG